MIKSVSSFCFVLSIKIITVGFISRLYWSFQPSYMPHPYVIGDLAYVASDVLEIENDYIGAFVIPEKDIVVIEIP